MSPSAPMVVPGTYKVTLAKRVEGELTDLGLGQTFEVRSIRDPALPGSRPEDAVAFQRKLAELQRSVEGAASTIAETETRLRAMREALMRSVVEDAALDDAVRARERRLADLKQALSGSRTRNNMGDPGPVSIQRRVSVAGMGTRSSMYGPTPTHRTSVEIAEEQFATLRADLRKLVEDELADLERRLEAAGVPWTPGRGVP